MDFFWKIHAVLAKYPDQLLCRRHCAISEAVHLKTHDIDSQRDGALRLGLRRSKGIPFETGSFFDHDYKPVKYSATD
jgi:hypothetical protein